MADDELYRKQIVIEVVDNDAVTKVNRFEQKFNQSMARIEKMANVLGGKQIAPTITAKDRFSSSAQKAERMMNSINRMEAKPTLKVRDMATSTINGIDRGLRSLTNKTWNIGLKVAGGALSTVKNVISGIGHAITSPLGMLGIGVGAAGAIQGGIIQPLNLAGNMEQSQIAFETMLGSAQKAKNFLTDLQHFAAVTPFEFPQLQDASKKLLAFGFSAKSIIPMMTAIGNAASGLGLGSEGIDRITLALGQMRAKAKVSADEMMQLTEAGVPAWDILAKSMGKSTAEVMKLSQQGLIPADKAINALITGMNERFPNMMEKQSRTLQGLWSTIKDTFDMNILFKWGEGVRKAIEPKLSKLVDWFNKNQDKLSKWGDQIEKIANQASQWLIDKFSNAINWINRNFLSNEKFKNMSFEGKIHFIWDKIGEEFNKWYEGKGKALVTSWGEKIGSGLGAGLMALAGVDVSKNIKNNPFVDAGSAAGEAFLKGFDKSFDFDKFMQTKLGKWGSIILGGFIGARVGGLSGAAIGAGAAGTYSAWNNKKFNWEDLIMPSLLVGGLVPGGIKISKWIENLFKSNKTIGTAKATGNAISEVADVAAKSNKIIYGPTGEIIKNVAESTSNVAKAASEVSKLAKVANGLDAISKPLSKIAVPIGATWSIIDIFKSNDKLKTIGREAGGWAGTFAGAKLGAAGGATLGSIIPGIGTAVGAGIGGLLGGIGGFFGGNWLGGKVVDWGRNLFGKKTVNKTAAMANTQGADMNAYLNKNVYEPFRNYVNRAESWGRNLIGNFMRGRDSAGMSMYGWLNNKVYLPFASMVVRATAWGRNLIRNFNIGMSQIPIQTPHVTMPTGPQEAHATGGILTRPHFALVAEEGPEAVIPLSIKRRERALRLWQETGRYLGVQAYAKGGYTVPVRMATAGTGTIINLNFDLAGLVGQIVINNQEGINRSVDEIAAIIAQKIKSILQNLT